MGNKNSAVSRSSSVARHTKSENDVSNTPPHYNEDGWKNNDQYLNQYEHVPVMSQKWPMERETPDGGTPNDGSPNLKHISFQPNPLPVASPSNHPESHSSSKDQTNQTEPERKSSRITKKGSPTKVG